MTRPTPASERASTAPLATGTLATGTLATGTLATGILATGILAIRDVHVRIGKTHILQGIDVTLRPGELCALIGPSGAGKSTLIKVLLGLRTPERGRVALGGRPVSESGPIGYVPQDDALHRTLTVRQALDFAARLRLPELRAEERSKRLEEVCVQVGLDERLDLRIKKLSGGQRKRVSVALELLTQPPVLILDEPTSGLDPGLEARMMGLFADLAATGRSVLVATHAMQSLERCHALILLVGGHLAWFGRPADALSWFRTDRYEGIFDQLPKMQPAAWARRYAGSQERVRFLDRAEPGDAQPAPEAPSAAEPPPEPEPEPEALPAVSAPEPSQPAPPSPPVPEADLDAQLAALKARMQRGDS